MKLLSVVYTLGVLMVAFGAFSHADPLPSWTDEDMEESPCRYNEYEKEGECKPCPSCPQGEGLSELCGLGKGQNATCEPCLPQTFNDEKGLQVCRPCTVCKVTVYRHELDACTPGSDTNCRGSCIADYYGDIPSPDLQAPPCHFCGEIDREPSSPIPENCTDYWNRRDKLVKKKSVITIVIPVTVIFVAFVIIVAIFCYCFRNKVKNCCKCCFPKMKQEVPPLPEQADDDEEKRALNQEIPPPEAQAA